MSAGDFIVCDNCGEELLHAKDSNTDKLVQFTAICVCGHKNVRLFNGYPKLAGVDKYYFDFTDEYEVRCGYRHRSAKK